MSAEVREGREMTGREMPGHESSSHPADPRHDAALQARLRRILFGIVLLCVALGAAGFAFVRWMATLPPGSLKIH